MANSPRSERIENYYKNKLADVILVLDNVHDPHNVAAVTRSADGLGIPVIGLYYTHNVYPNMKKTGKKSSATANKWMQFQKIKDWEAFAHEKKSEGYTIYGADIMPEAEQVTRVTFAKKSLIVLGAEHEGISPEIKKTCDAFVQIPMVGMVQSYNISVAAALIMYEVFKQKGTHLKIRE